MARRSGVGLQESVHDHAALEERLLHVKITRKSLNQLLSKSSLLMKSSSSKQTLVPIANTRATAVYSSGKSVSMALLGLSARVFFQDWPICYLDTPTRAQTHLPLSSVELVRSYRQDENHLDP